MKQNNNFKDIVTKYGYSIELADFLKLIYDELVLYFGNDLEPIIYEAFLNTEVVSCNNLYDYFKDNDLLENDEGSIVSNDDLKRASGVYVRKPIINYNDSSNEFNIVGTKGVVAISNLDLNTDFIKGILIHELGHMVKGYYNEFSIDGNILTTRSGLIETKEELSVKDGKVVKRVISEVGVGLEEGLNTVLEVDIARRLISPDYSVTGYKTIEAIARSFLKIKELKRLILNAEMLKDKSGFINNFDGMFMDNSYNMLEQVVDLIYKLGLKQFSEIFNPEALKATTSEIDNVIINSYNPLIVKMVESRNNRKVVG